MRALLLLILLLLPALAGAKPLGFSIGTSKPVVVDVSGGVPRVWLDFGGGESRAATYRGGSGTQVLEFAYDVAAGDFAPSGIIAAGEIELAGGSIRDAAGNPLTLTFTPPDLSGVKVQTYRAAWTTDPVTSANANAAAFQITKTPPGATFDWQITSDGGGTLSGSGTIAASPHPVTGIDLSALADGTLTLTVTLTTPAGTGAARTATVVKTTTIDCTDPAILAANSPGARCADGSIYAGSLNGNHLITHVSGCGYEPGGSATTKAGAAFTPTCSGATDSITKRWSNDPYGGNGAHSQGDGRLNTNQLIADVQYQNSAAGYCHHLDLYGQTDWYLPARDELNLLFQNRNVIGGFSGGAGTVWDNNSSIYWSSTEGILQFFSDGYSHGWFKTNSYRLRCIRTLTPPPAVPSGYGVAWTSAPVTVANQGSGGFQLSSAPIGAAFSYAITSSGGGSAIRGAGAVASATHSVSGLNLSALPDGVLTVSVVLTNGGGSGAAATDTVAKDAAAPAGHAVAFTTDPVTAGNAGAGAFQFSGAEVGAAFSYTITSSGGAGSVSGSGTISSATQAVAGLDLSGLPDGTLTVEVVLTDAAGNAGAAVSDTVVMDTAAPAGQAVAFTTDPVNAGNAAAGAFEITSAEVGAGYAYEVTSSGGAGSVSGSGTVASAMQAVAGLDLSGLADGTLTVEVVLTDAAGNAAAAVTATAAKDAAAPAGQGVAWTTDPVNAGNAAAGAFEISGAEVGAGFAYEVTSSGGAGSVSGSGTISGATQAVSGLDLSGLADGTLTVEVVLTDAAGNAAAAVTATAAKDAAAPAGQGVAWTTDPVNAGNAAAGAFEITSAEVGAGFSYSVTSSGGAGSVSGSGTVASATQAVAGLDLSGLPDGTLTVEVVLTDAAGNAAAAVSNTVAKATAAAAYSVWWGTSPEITGQTFGSFNISGATVGASGAWTITSSGGAGSVSGTISSISGATQGVSNVYLGDLPDGTLTVSFVQTVSGVAGPAATATIGKTTLDCTDAAALAAATPGARCQDGAIYAGSYNGAYYLTHRAGCGHNPGSGLPSSAASSDFTPSCTTLTDSISKIWSDSGGFNEGANDGGNGALNTQTLMADAQATNPAAAYCHHLVINGRSAWFLPSAGEIGLLWTYRSGILGLSGTYWTSTQSHLNPTTSVRSRSLSLGTTPDTLKTSSARLRCMHAAP